MTTVPRPAADPLILGAPIESAALWGGVSRRTFLNGVLGAGAAAAGGSLLAACGGGGSLGGAGATSASLTASAASAGAAGEITIWDRSGDLFKVFDGVIASFNKVSVRTAPGSDRFLDPLAAGSSSARRPASR